MEKEGFEWMPVGLYGYWIWDIKGEIDYSGSFPHEGLDMRLVTFYPSDGKSEPPESVIKEAQGYVLQVCEGETCRVADYRKGRK